MKDLEKLLYKLDRISLYHLVMRQLVMDLPHLNEDELRNLCEKIVDDIPPEKTLLRQWEIMNDLIGNDHGDVN